MPMKVSTFFICFVNVCFGEEVLLRTPPENFKHKAEVVVVLPFIDEKVLLLQRNSAHSQAGLWVMPGGKKEPNETVLEAGVRELEEETGILADEENLIHLGTFYIRYPNGDFLFHLYKLSIEGFSEVALQVREHQNYTLCTIDEALQLPLSPGMDECFDLALSPSD